MNHLRLLAGLIAASLLGMEFVAAEVVTNRPFRGVTYITRTETSPRPVSMHIVVVDLAAPGIRFKLTPPGGTRDTIRQRTADFLNQEHAQVAINGHFFLPFPSDDINANVVGFAASLGTGYSPFEPQPIGATYVDQSYAILPYAPALNIDVSNHASIVHWDFHYPDNKHVVESVAIWNAVAGSAQIITDGVKTIPTYSGPPNGLNPGNGYWDQYSWYELPRARTCIGLSQDGRTLVLFTVDEAGGSEGMTPGEIADLLIRDYHVSSALNLDGGGSTSMALQDPATHIGQIVNVSSDNPNGRATGSNLAVFADPNIEPGPRLTLVLVSPKSLLISWPAPATGWRLQQNSGLSSTNWVNVTKTPRKVKGQMQVSLSRDSSRKFYRLAK